MHHRQRRGLPRGVAVDGVPALSDDRREEEDPGRPCEEDEDGDPRPFDSDDWYVETRRARYQGCEVGVR